MINTKQLELKTTYNTRELGGIPSISGTYTKYGQFLRSDSVANLTKEEIDELYEYGIRTIIDLRSSEELEMTGHVLKENARFNFQHTPIYSVSPQELAMKLMVSPLSFLEQYYLEVLKEKNTLANALKTIASAPEGGILFHCFVGKDRTGLIAMLLLSLGNVEFSEIVKDYVPSFENIKQSPEIQALLETQPAEMFYSKPEYMETVLDYLYTNYTSVENYVKALGLSEDEISSIKARLI
ncbi:MAG: tyrosine-protein phosphatase [Streptococcaceae bacterium]|jgi:protein-tyrosine phosphatase|nr:tyrosine-protein phosphatase [Streptococcaceae bacterium]